ncbi:hypothetical protein GCM10010420_31230 [Streptomyces glaucosporus]|uniref:Transglycosylase SLT domain-containing protein n=1 Tax=Streptomyces glaucosporus TaxID=284044 RepID=A0ABN3IF31_9ACTN
MTARLGGLVGRVRRGVTSTAIAAAAMAALTASQGPGLEFVQPGGKDAASSPDVPDLPADGNSPYHTELPPLVKPDRPGSSNDLPAATGPAESGIPASVLAAYKKAERTLNSEQPGCNLPWQLLAAIGKVESGQARGGAVDEGGTTLRPILGPALNGVGFAHISDTDNGAYDGDTRYDRAVGPMQFIPSTWATWGADGNGDGREDPNNIYDAALAAGRYLCAGGRDLSNPADLERAILSYNHSRDYLRTVLSWLEFYRKGVHEVPDGKGVLPETPGAGNESRPAKPATDPDSRSKGGSKGPEKGGSKGGGKDDGKDDKPSTPPPASGEGTIEPKPDEPGTPPEKPDPKPEPEPDEPGTPPEDPEPEPDEPTEPDPTCPADPDDPKDPEDPENPGEDPKDPGEDPKDPEKDPENPGEDPKDPEKDPEGPGEDPEDPDKDPEDPCGDPEDEDGGDEPQDDPEGGETPAPDTALTVGGAVTGRQD